MKQNARKYPKSLFAFLVAGIVVLTAVIALEITSYFIIVSRGYNFYLPLDLQRLTEILADYETLEMFSAELGWEPVYQNSLGYRGDEKVIDEAALAVFGDSFTQGHPWLEGSWPYLLEQRLGNPVLNFGVGSYGADQALLRFRLRYLNRVSSKYVALCIMSENIARVVNVYRGFYMRRVQIRLTKPRFELTENGSLRLVPNPISSYEELSLLEDMEFLKKLGENDYWFKYFEQFDLNRHARFPYSVSILRALPFYVKRIFSYRFGSNADYKALYSDAEATTILRQIIIEFIRDVEAAKAIPVILIFPNTMDLTDYSTDGRTVYEDFYQTVKSDIYPHVFDGLQYFKPHMAAGRSADDFFRTGDGHYNLESEQIVSDGLYDDLCRIDQKLGLLQSCLH